MLGEPSRTQYDLNFRIGEVPIRVHPFFWLVALLLGGSARDPKLIIIWIAVLFLSILVHELGHVLAFRYFGIRSSVVLYGMGGLAIPDGSYSYGSNRGDRGTSRIIISLAGPAAGFLLAAIVVAIIAAVNRSIDFSIFGYLNLQLGFGPRMFPAFDELPPEIAERLAEQNLAMVPYELYFTISQLLFVNIVWGLVNLLPVYPLDGGQVSRELFLKYDTSRGVHNSLMLSIIAGGAMALFALSQQRFFVALMFGMLAYQSYQYMQMNSGGWGGYGGYGGGRRPW